jgi:hypothetical protein
LVRALDGAKESNDLEENPGRQEMEGRERRGVFAFDAEFDKFEEKDKACRRKNAEKDPGADFNVFPLEHPDARRTFGRDFLKTRMIV